MKPEAVTTYTPILWATLSDEAKYEEYIRVRTLRAEVSSPARQLPSKAQIAGCCHIHHPTLGSDPAFRSVPFENCSWCQKIKRLAGAASPAPPQLEIHPSILWLIAQVESKATGLDVEWEAVKALLSTYNSRPELWAASAAPPAESQK